MAHAVNTNTGHNPNEISADAGYFSEDNIGFLEKEVIDAYTYLQISSLIPGLKNRLREDKSQAT